MNGSIGRIPKIDEAAPTVLFLTRSLDRGGAERQLVALVIGLKHRGWDVSIACFYPDGPLQQEVMDAEIPVFNMGKRGRWDIVGFLVRLARHVRAMQPDIIHGYMAVANILGLLLRPLIPRTQVVWGIRASNMDLTRYDRLSRLVFRVECWLSRFVDLVISNSKAGMEHYVAHGFPRQKIIVLANGVDTCRFRFDREARLRLRRQWGIDDSSALVGLPARVDAMKDHATFFSAAQQLAIDGDHWRFICIGDGTRMLASGRGSQPIPGPLWSRMILAGPRDDMPSVYSAIDIAVSCSAFGEGFSNAVAEAMSCGCPCIVTDVGDSADIVGTTGNVVPPGDPKKLAESIRELESRVARKPGQMQFAAREHITENFGISELITKTARALQALSSSADTGTTTQ